MNQKRINLIDDNKYKNYLDEYKHNTIIKVQANGYPTVDHKDRFIEDTEIRTLETFDGRDKWGDFLTPLSHVSQSSWNTAVTRTLSSRFSILSVGQIMPKINYTTMMYCPIRDIMIEDEKTDIFKKSLYYAINYMYVFGTSHVGCFNYKLLLEKGYAKFEEFKDISDMIERYKSCRSIIGPDHSQCLDNTDARLFRSIFNINLAPNVESIKWEIAKFGPVISVMNVYDDFKYYDGLEIHHGPKDSETKIGARCVIIMGWGKDEEGKEYWILDPGLGTTWGREGYFYCYINTEKLDIENNVVSVYPDFAVFSDYILNFYKNYTIEKKLTEMRSIVKIDPNSFLVEKRKNFVKKNYPNIKLDYIDNKLLPDYNIFFAKDVELFVFKKKVRTGFSKPLFIIITLLIIFIGVVMLKKK